ncbi:unnamed protein product [Wuchereria bancrofti]|uniref:Uncharacterized protein n=1 Tax=Wuchereria bancrofti TaxID=6293 RepID=A0A3P7DF52_WUCBA|nr:unnamed protein product [Wuchereria bancrofti]
MKSVVRGFDYSPSKNWSQETYVGRSHNPAGYCNINNRGGFRNSFGRRGRSNSHHSSNFFQNKAFHPCVSDNIMRNCGRGTPSDYAEYSRKGSGTIGLAANWDIAPMKRARTGSGAAVPLYSANELVSQSLFGTAVQQFAGNVCGGERVDPLDAIDEKFKRWWRNVDGSDEYGSF